MEVYSFCTIRPTFDTVFNSIVNDIRYQFQSGNTITRLIIVNVALFLAITLFQLILLVSSGFKPQHGLFGEVTNYLFLSDDLLWDAKHPWTILTHMFTHIGFFHLLFNVTGVDGSAFCGATCRISSLYCVCFAFLSAA